MRRPGVLALSCFFFLLAAVWIHSASGLEERVPRFEVERDSKRFTNQNRFRNGGNGRTRTPKQKATSATTSPNGETDRPRFGQLYTRAYSPIGKSQFSPNGSIGGLENVADVLPTVTSTQQTPHRNSEFLKGKSKLNCANFVEIFTETLTTKYFVCTNRSL